MFLAVQSPCLTIWLTAQTVSHFISAVLRKVGTTFFFYFTVEWFLVPYMYFSLLDITRFLPETKGRMHMGYPLVSSQHPVE